MIIKKDINIELVSVPIISENMVKCMCINQKEQCSAIKHLCVCNVYPTFCKATHHVFCVCKYNLEHCKTNNFHDCSCIFLPEKCKSDTHICVCKTKPGKCKKKYIHDCVCMEFYEHCKKDCIHVCICAINTEKCRRIIQHNCTCILDSEQCRKDHQLSRLEKIIRKFENSCFECVIS